MTKKANRKRRHYKVKPYWFDKMLYFQGKAIKKIEVPRWKSQAVSVVISGREVKQLREAGITEFFIKHLESKACQ